MTIVPLCRDDLRADPLDQFAAWFDEARASALAQPTACALATATLDGAPSVRMVLLKGFDADGVTFFTGYESRKGAELAANPRAALCFWWEPPGRQVRVEGPVERVAAAESDAYFASRPQGSRLSAAASRQSEPVGSRAELEERVAELELAHPDVVPRPGRWGGYRLHPAAWEFWQHRDDRLHDRFRYAAAGGGWAIERLQP